MTSKCVSTMYPGIFCCVCPYPCVDSIYCNIHEEVGKQQAEQLVTSN